MWLKSMDKLYRKHPTQCSTGILWKNTLSTYNLEYGTSSLTFTSFTSSSCCIQTNDRGHREPGTSQLWRLRTTDCRTDRLDSLLFETFVEPLYPQTLHGTAILVWIPSDSLAVLPIRLSRGGEHRGRPEAKTTRAEKGPKRRVRGGRRLIDMMRRARMDEDQCFKTID